MNQVFVSVSARYPTSPAACLHVTDYKCVKRRTFCFKSCTKWPLHIKSYTPSLWICAGIVIKRWKIYKKKTVFKNNCKWYNIVSLTLKIEVFTHAAICAALVQSNALLTTQEGMKYLHYKCLYFANAVCSPFSLWLQISTVSNSTHFCIIFLLTASRLHYLGIWAKQVTAFILFSA